MSASAEAAVPSSTIEPLPVQRGRLLRALIGGILAAVGVGLASRWIWLCDDAFISFRYAQHLVDGHGLVFNTGPGAEVVEGYTNALWTVWLAGGMAVGVPPELWSVIWGLAAFAALIALLCRGAALPWLPLAAALTVVSRPLQIWATGGLETAADLALLVLGWQLATRRDADGAVGGDRRRAAWAGAVLASATMTRPDSLLVAAIVGATLVGEALLYGGGLDDGRLRDGGLRDGLSACRRSLSHGAIGRYLVGFIILWGPFTVWRLLTYGDFFPNTYYAKSAGRWWLDQGAVYVGLFVRELPLFAVAPIVGGGALLLGRVARHRRPRLVSAWLICVAFTAYVAKVGGGFMHTRLLLPALPFAWVLIEAAVVAWLRGGGVLPPTRRRGALAMAAVLLLGTAAAPPALDATERVHGIVDERAHYDPARAQRLERDAQVLRRFLAGLPVRAAYIGGQARLVYRTGVPVAVEAETGLTDKHIAHQRLRQRGRVGHEKHASPSYLVDQRRLHLVFGAFAFRYLGLEGYVPKVGVRLGSTTVFLLTWDPALMAELRRRGAVIPPFEREARRLLADPTLIPAAQRERTLASLRRFWRR